jgi:S-formylglutathione hydrolase
MQLKLESDQKCFEGSQKVYSHYSEICKCNMTFGIFLPKKSVNTNVPVLWFLSGLTCTHENAMTKSGAQTWAAEKGLAVIFPDTSPRGGDVPDDDSFDIGQGAGFYLDASEDPWNKNFNMETYVKHELSELVFRNFNLDQSRQGITGHSMGGMGALNLALKNQNQFKSVSAFSPISNPTQSNWGRRQFEAYLGEETDEWKNYDPSILLESLGFQTKILIDQGTGDNFLDLLMPKNLSDQMDKNLDIGNFRYQEGYDHSYFFVSSFIRDHIFHHADILLK